MIVKGGYYKLSYPVAPKLMIVFILQHLLFSVTDPQYRTKPPGVSDVSSIRHVFPTEEFSSLCMYFFFLSDSTLSPDNSLHCQIMWAEAMAKLEGMESADRERLWPQLVQGFKDLSQRLKVFQFTAKCVVQFIYYVLRYLSQSLKVVCRPYFFHI